MLVKIVGIENSKFEIKENEEIKEIEGQRLYYEYELNKIKGKGTGSIFEMNGQREIGETIEVRWSKMFKKFYIVKKKEPKNETEKEN